MRAYYTARGKTARTSHKYCMDTFNLYLLAREHFDPSQYNALFRQEIEALLPKLTSPQQREHLQGIRTFDWTGYILASLRNAGFKGQEIEDRAHEVVVRLLVTPGKLFAGYDERRHGPLLARFKVAVANAVKNLVAKERRRRDLMYQGCYPLAFLWLPERDQRIIEDFRKFVHQRLGLLGLAVLDARLDGDQMKVLVGDLALGNPTAYLIKTVVRRLKALAVEYGQATGDPDFMARAEVLRRRVRGT